MAGNDIPLVSETHEGVDLVTPVEERHRVTRFLSTPASLAVIFLLYFVTVWYFVEGISLTFLVVVAWIATNHLEYTPPCTKHDWMTTTEYDRSARTSSFDKFKAHHLTSMPELATLILYMVLFAVNFIPERIFATLPDALQPNTTAHSMFIVVSPYVFSTVILFAASAIPGQLRNGPLLIFGARCADCFGYLLVSYSPYSIRQSTVGIFLVLLGTYITFSMSLMLMIHNFSEKNRLLLCLLMVTWPVSIMLRDIYFTVDVFTIQWWMTRAMAMVCTIVLCRRVK